MEDVSQKVISFMEEHRMLLPGERVVAGISGGADSVCLLFMLSEWQKRHSLEWAVVHVDHGIRPESGEDARFVEELCRRQGIPFYLREADVRGYAAREKCSEEEAGRLLRYEIFEAAAEEFGAAKIAVAHNLNDRSETMLFNLFRGTGIRGLAGILPVRDNIIRPLLCLERGEIERFLEERGQSYCLDVTNEADDYTRNRIRHHILPYAEREIVSGCVQHMGRTAGLLEETEDYLALQTAEALKRCVRGPAKELGGGAQNLAKSASEYRLEVQTFLTFHPALQKRMLHALIKSLSPGAKDISLVHVEDVLTLFATEGNRAFCLPFGICARREYKEVILRRGPAGEDAAQGQPLEGISLDFSVLAAEDLPRTVEKALIFPENQYTKWFDYDKIERQPILRTRAAGDYLTIADGHGGMHHKSLKAYMVEMKIPKEQRCRIPVLAEDSHIIWLAGYRISEYYKVTENTKRVLQVQLKKEYKTEDKNGGTCESTVE